MSRQRRQRKSQKRWFIDGILARIEEHVARGVIPPFDVIHEPHCPWSVRHPRCTCNPAVVPVEILFRDYDLCIDGEDVWVRRKADTPRPA
ncbi:MAG TPA: hypothetical protein VMG10_05050 [Gemmataceae bacterium]|nr:hypothetical protein [Gemmataceae bacterium]